MQNPLLLDLVIFLTNNNLIAGDGVDAFRDFMPESPDNVVVFMEYTGMPQVSYDTAVNRSVQVSVRNTSADEARKLALRIYKLIVDKKEEDNKIILSDNRWGQIYLRNPPCKIDTDNQDRVTYGFNIGITTTIE